MHETPGGALHDYLVAIFGGVVSGLIVAGVLTIFRFLDKPQFAAIAGPENTVTMFNNRLRPAVIGGTWAMCEGSVVSENSPRGGEHGILLRPRTSTVLKRSEYLSLGETFDMTIRYVPLWRHVVKRLPADYLQWQMDPVNLATTSTAQQRRKWRRFPIMLKSA